MKRITFGHKLLNFANSVDILEEESFGKIQDYIESYLREVLKIKYVRLMLMRETVNGQLMLVKYTLNRDEQTFLPIKDGEKYNGQMAYAFDQNRRLWITADSETKTLNNCTRYVDHWSSTESESLPPYQQIDHTVDIKTSILVPIRRDNKITDNNYILGVVNFESQKYLRFNKNAEQELKDISFTLGKLFQLYEARKFQKTNTFAVITELKNELHEFTEEFENYFFERKPNIFFAFSSRGDREVIGTVKEVVRNEFAYSLTLIEWDDEKNLGAITPQMLENIKNSEYFICYLSEKDENSFFYLDNPNVLIELGLFLGKQIRTGHFKNIIILRESNSKMPLPFDIQDMFTLEVSRYGEEKKLNRDAFISSISRKIDTFLKSDI